ncbi:MAG: hypothetical protein MJZ15_09730 [Bacteroidales bacterium]|nr:hypothetical protein [Bacteroidales bacterium]
MNRNRSENWIFPHLSIGQALSDQLANVQAHGAVAQYSTLATNPQMYAAKYLTYLPTKEQLRKEIEQQKEIFSMQQKDEE